MRSPCSLRGFTLVEIMIVVVLIGLLAALAIPAMRKASENSALGAMNNDARQIGHAAQRYWLENPAETSLAYSVDPATGQIITASTITEYVKQISRGITSVNTLTPTGAFTMSHVQVQNGAVFSYDAQGSKLSPP